MSSSGAILSVNILLESDMAVIAIALRPVLRTTSRHAFASTDVSERFAYTLDETITAGIALSGFNSFRAITEPTSIGNPW